MASYRIWRREKRRRHEDPPSLERLLNVNSVLWQFGNNLCLIVSKFLIVLFFEIAVTITRFADTDVYSHPAESALVASQEEVVLPVQNSQSM
jgi:hypothetical protein